MVRLIITCVLLLLSKVMLIGQGRKDLQNYLLQKCIKEADLYHLEKKGLD